MKERQERDEMRIHQIPEPAIAARMVDRVEELLLRKDFEFCELLSGLCMLGWGVVLLMPWSTFSTSTGYAAMSVVPEAIWSAIMIWTGITQIGALVLDQYRPRLLSSLGAAMLWVFVSIAIGWSNPYGTGVVVYPSLALASGWAFLRMCRAAGT